jgi:phenylalanyl-tRNA synthetase beta chain
MKLSYNWLSQLVDLHDIDPREVALRLTMATAEIESVLEVGEDLKGVVIGKILEVKPHPSSDHLFLTRIDVGDKTLDIVSGAPNTRQGVSVPVALVGVRLPGGNKVKKVKIRGAPSSGIVCSEKEVGVSDDHTGLWILNGDGVDDSALVPGTPLTRRFPTKDYIIEIDNKSITNRPDLWGHYGFARELSAIFMRKLLPIYPEEIYSRISDAEETYPLTVKVHATDLCPRYSALMLEGIEVKHSPYWLRRRLSTLDVRPINNIVDVTNLVMLECGQPLHAFDASKLEKSTIIVRRAKEGESCTTLDGVIRKLTGETLLIADPSCSVAVAGVMGGQNSEIGEETERIVIESANFDPVSVRRTASRLGLRTEASNRFEKSIDPALTVTGIAGCVSYLSDLLPSIKVCSALVDVSQARGKNVALSLNMEWVSKLLGAEVTEEVASAILRRLEFEVTEQGEGNMRVVVPSFRATKDVGIPHDLVEEIGRIYGYSNIEPVLPSIESIPVQRDEQLFLVRMLKNVFSEELSLTEVFTYSFHEDEILELFYGEDEEFVRLRNPISTKLSRMRRSLVPGLFSLVERNFTFATEFSLFEIGSVFSRRNRKGALPRERKMAAVLLLREIGKQPVFFHLKGALETLFIRLNVEDVAYTPFENGEGYECSFDIAEVGKWESYHPGRSALLVSGSICFGILAELNPQLLKTVGVDFHTHRIAVFELDLLLFAELAKKGMGKKKYVKIPKFPEVVLALACVVEETVPVTEVEEFIRSYRSDLIENVELFDIYRGEPLQEGKKSLAFNICYRKADRTLTEQEANEVHEEIARRIRKHGWELR